MKSDTNRTNYKQRNEHACRASCAEQWNFNEPSSELLAAMYIYIIA